MKTISEELKTHIETGVTTICRVWRVTRKDGVVLGFTEHDCDLNFAGTTFRAASGFQPSEVEAATGLAASSSDVAGAFSSDAISAEDLTLGLYDGAKVEVYVVNWADVSQHMLEEVRELGEVTRTENHFQAELRGLAARLDQAQGRVFSRRCDAELGGKRCGIVLTSANYSASGAVLAAGKSQVTVSGLGGYSSGYFRYGVLTFSNGELNGIAADIGAHKKTNGSVTLTFWLPLAKAPQVGDTFDIVAGCDKSFATCKAKFDNALNFQGFPHMPGSDFAYSYASGSVTHDGSPLYE